MPYKDPVKQKEYHKQYREKHREHRRELCKRWYKEHARVDVHNYLDPAYSWEEVEGYDGWTTNVDVHHRREGIGYSMAQLIEQGQYYNCLPSDLICVTKAEHKRIHEEIDKFFGRGNYAQSQRQRDSNGRFIKQTTTNKR